MRVHSATDSPARRLVCFPHAGGTANVFSEWPDWLPPDVEMLAVQYPGRQDRLAEPCLEDMGALADQLSAEIADLGDLPMTMFGHSMGSAVAYEVALRLEGDTGYVADRIFVSARTAPHRRDGEPNHQLTDRELIAAIRDLGGADAEVLDLEQLWPLILPPLRADLRLLDKHRPEVLVPLRAPIIAFGGDADQTCAVDELQAWRDATSAGLKIRVFPGGHHYLWQNTTAVVAAIAKTFAARRSTLP